MKAVVEQVDEGDRESGLTKTSGAFECSPSPCRYVPEISPLALRAKSAALLSLSQNIAQAFNQFVSKPIFNFYGV